MYLFLLLMWYVHHTNTSRRWWSSSLLHSRKQRPPRAVWFFNSFTWLNFVPSLFPSSEKWQHHHQKRKRSSSPRNHATWRLVPVFRNRLLYPVTQLHLQFVFFVFLFLLLLSVLPLFSLFGRLHRFLYSVALSHFPWLSLPSGIIRRIQTRLSRPA